MGNNHGNQNNHEQNNSHNHDEKDKRKKTKCSTETCEKISIALPAEISAHADVKDIVLKCTDKRVVKEHKKNSMKLEIVQEMFAKIPIDFVAEVEVKDEKVDFDTHECN
jgi:hypothetical protein